jgi:phenylalanyl-tRNA synthetase beta chain
MTFRTAQLTRLAGIELEPPVIRAHLAGLGFAIAGGPDSWTIVPPSWRHDVTTEACIVEELARLHGFDRIAPIPVTRVSPVNRGVLTAEQRRRAAVRRAVAAAGHAEAVTWSFIPPEQAQLFGHEQRLLMRNPLNAELSAMRPSLIPNLLTAVARNLAHSIDLGAIFEIGPRYLGAMPGEQAWAVAGIRFGAAAPRQWARPDRKADALDAKADALAALAAAGVKVEAVRVTTDPPDWYHPGRAGRLRLGPTVLASFGELHPRALGMFGIEVAVVAFELDLDGLPMPRETAGRARPPLEALPYPPVDRDFAFLVDVAVPAEDLLKAVRGAEKRLIREARLFDVYEGKGVPEGKRSLAVAVRLQSAERTLGEAEIEATAARIVAAAGKAVGAVLRA